MGNGVQVALCGMKCVTLNNETLKILGVYFSYDKNLEQDKNFSEHFKFMAHETVNFRGTNYGVPILGYF